MVEAMSPHYPMTYRLLRFISAILAGGTIAQAFGCLAAYSLMNDSQAAGMVAHIVIQHLSYCFLGCAFVILSITNVLIKRGAYSLKNIRLPSLILLVAIATASFLLIPRMDYLRETALIDGMPVMLSSFAYYFQTLNILVLMLLLTQIISSVLVAWRLFDSEST
jgi:hypothetical protein